ncbi:MAG: hypothetical protein FD153_1854 [Rhodospirillaceae bacterium]|nr:MAG: hypothetical protein FD153_1854 [Rhodospirillaceae bacterium]
MSGQVVTAGDIVVGLVMLLSGLIGFMRGFVHEILGIAAWGGAVFAALYGLVWARPFARDLIPLTWAADAAAVVVIFLVTLLVLSMLFRAVAHMLRTSLFSSLDCSLGFLFGLARGALVVSLAYLLVESLMQPTDHPSSLFLMQHGAALIRAVVPDELSGKARSTTAAAVERVRQMKEAEKTYQQLSNPLPVRRAPDGQPLP